MKRRILLTAALLAVTAVPAKAQLEQRVWAVAMPKQGDAVLRYAFAETKDLMLGFTCAKKSGQISIVAASPVRLNEPIDPDAPPATPIAVSRPATIIVMTKAWTARLPGRVRPDTTYGGTSIVTEISTRSPVIQDFAKIRLVRVGLFGEFVQAPEVPKAMLKKFLKFCG